MSAAVYATQLGEPPLPTCLCSVLSASLGCTLAAPRPVSKAPCTRCVLDPQRGIVGCRHQSGGTPRRADSHTHTRTHVAATHAMHDQRNTYPHAPSLVPAPDRCHTHPNTQGDVDFHSAAVNTHIFPMCRNRVSQWIYRRGAHKYFLVPCWGYDRCTILNSIAATKGGSSCGRHERAGQVGAVGCGCVIGVAGGSATVTRGGRTSVRVPFWMFHVVFAHCSSFLVKFCDLRSFHHLQARW